MLERGAVSPRKCLTCGEKARKIERMETQVSETDFEEALVSADGALLAGDWPAGIELNSGSEPGEMLPMATT